MNSIKRLSVFISHGEFDPVFPLNIGVQNYEYFREKVEYIKFVTYPVGHIISADNKRDLILWLHESNKTWVS